MRRRSVLLLTLGATGCQLSDVESDAPKTGKSEQEVHYTNDGNSGLDHPAANHPQIVSVTTPAGSGMATCTGTLVASDAVLTAAHCLNTNSAPGGLFVPPGPSFKFKVLFNNLDASQAAAFRSFVPKAPGEASEFVVHVKQAIAHPQFTKNSDVSFDMAVLVLEEEVSRAVMKPLGVVPSFVGLTQYWTGYDMKFFGSGPTSADCESANRVAWIRTETTQISFDSPAEATHGMFVFSDKDGPTGGHLCRGDSGGPFLTYQPWNTDHLASGQLSDLIVSISSASPATSLDELDDEGKELGPVLQRLGNRNFLVQHALDRDGDGREAHVDNCDTIAATQWDNDGDGIGNGCDPCPEDGLHADFDHDGTLDCVQPCYGGDDSDVDEDGIPACIDPCPLEGSPGGTGEHDGDFDGDLVCDSVDNCPSMANPGQGDANLRSELAHTNGVPGEGVLGDRCDPVPVPDARTDERILETSTPTPCVDPQCPGLTAADGAYVYCGTLLSDEFHLRPLRSQSNVFPDLFENVTAGTGARFCQKDEAQSRTCVDPDFDLLDSYIANGPGSTAEETSSTRWLRVSFSSGGPADPNAGPVTLSYDDKYNDPYGTNPNEVWTWNYQADHARWSAAGIIDSQLAQPSDLLGAFWFHAFTSVGSGPGRQQLANRYIADNQGSSTVESNPADNEGYRPETAGYCYKCTHHEIPYVPEYVSPAGGGSFAQASSSTAGAVFVLRTPLDAPEAAYVRTGGRRGEASVVAQIIHENLSAMRPVTHDCNSQIVDGVAAGLKARLAAGDVRWVPPAEPTATFADAGAFPMAVGLQNGTGADVVDTVVSDGLTFEVDADRGIVRAPSDNPPPVVNYVPVVSRTHRSIFLIGGEDIETGSNARSVWARPLDATRWRKMNIAPSSAAPGSYWPQHVLAATYSPATDELFWLDEVFVVVNLRNPLRFCGNREGPLT